MSQGMQILFFILIGVGFTGLGTMLALSRALSSGDEVQERLHTYAEIIEVQPRRSSGRRNPYWARLRLRLNAMFSAFASEELHLQLMSANWRITPLEYILVRLGVALAGLALGGLFFGWISGLALGFIVYLLTGVWLQRSIHRRRQAFENQLVDVLVLINGAVRAGFSLLQAMEVVEKEMKPPAAEEFHRLRREVGLGLPLSQALSNLAARMQNKDLNLMVTAINIHYQVGGNLATMLTAVTETIRDRIRLFKEVRVITTQQRYTSYLLSLLPFFVAAALFFLNPEYMSRLFAPGGYICIPIGAVVGIVLGYFVIRRLGRIEV